MNNRSVHHDEHILPNPNLHPVQFGGYDQEAGHGPIGMNSMNRTGSIGGTEMSADAHDVQGSSRRAADAIEQGQV